MKLYVLIACITAVVTFLLSIVVYRVSRRFHLYPAIRARDVHTKPTPRLGGVAMFLGMLVAFGVASRIGYFAIIFVDGRQIYAILGAALLIVVIGVVDDIWDLDWMTKLAGQFIAAGLIAWLGGVQIYSLPIGGQSVGSSVMSVAMAVLAMVLVMNAINFIDGLDGLVAGVALIANGIFFLYTYELQVATSASTYFNLGSLIAAILVGACVGFLPLNWHPARLFMGDAGAMLVGLMMATGAIAVTGDINPATLQALGKSPLLPAFIPIILPIAILIVPLIDFALAVLRRLRAGKSPFSADRKHLHHRLLDMGHSDVQAVLIFYAWTTVVAVGCLLLFVFDSWWIAAAFVAVGVIVCTIVTLAPLGRRKTQEALVELTPMGGRPAEATARMDPLDVASEKAVPPRKPVHPGRERRHDAT